MLSNWASFRYFADRFGVEHGRLISQFPKKWKRMVYDACAQCGDVERKKIEEKLSRESFDRKLFRSTRQYEPDLTWLRNAETQQAGGNPFRAIIASENPREHVEVRVGDDLDETDSQWNVPRQRLIERTPAALAGCASKLLRMSRDILIVDPYFDPQVARFRNVLKAFSDEISVGGHTLRRFELHASDRKNGVTEHWAEQCRRHLPQLIGDGVELRLVRWHQRPGGERLHGRYILTEHGGLGFDSGIDEGKPGETTDVTLLHPELCKQRWADFRDAAPCSDPQPTTYEKVDDIRIRGTRRRRR